MEILTLAFFVSLAYLIIFLKMLGLKRAIRWQVLLDVLVTFGLPALFIGTFSGMVLAALAGLFLSIELFVLGLVVNFIEPKNEHKAA